MPTPVADVNLPIVGTDGFFNELETAIVSSITTNGAGHYKLTQEKTGLFTAVETVTEIPEGAVLGENGDRYTLVGETHDYLFVHFSV